ncbi:hypothetical protein [Paracoccus sp. SCSIO 75233]|uniref:hypothetical protein n=1 Tax=Paracoccus sp. SCSIO 75233 TaxID=3017782 RepID=UPI0022EFEBBC|nr:hypothetical protein [Paracoccus sp. SCSIO 75233]WBU53666.1 hypothetical protein PAF12_02160 [Paracoccus sp. SCSIO 75233]
MLKNECSRNCWLAAAVAGLLVWIFSGAFFSGLLMGLITFFLLGSLLIWGVCRGRGGVAEDGEVLGERAEAIRASSSASASEDGILNRAEQAVVEASSAFAAGAVSAAEKGREAVQDWLKDDDDDDRARHAAERRDDDDRDDDDDDKDDGLLERAEERLEQAGEAVKDAMGAIAARGKEAISSLTEGDQGNAQPGGETAAGTDQGNDVTKLMGSDLNETVSPSGQSAVPTAATDAEPGDDRQKSADRDAGQSAAQTKTAVPDHDAAHPDADDLKQIKGVGPKLQEVLHENGITRFEQIAAWTDADIDHFAEVIGSMGGRIRSDDWVAQARLLAAGGDTEFSRRVDKGEVY